MAGSIITSAGMGAAAIGERPNIIISDIRNSISSDKLEGMLVNEELNIITAANGSALLREGCPNGKWHMMIIRDSGFVKSSFGILDEIRSFSDVPVMTLSDSCDEMYRTMALSKGADVCMSMDDFGTYEFKARIISLIRRYIGSESAAAHSSTCTERILTNGAISIDRRRREVYSDGVKIRMTAIEYGIMEYLMENCGSVCAVDDIYRRVWRDNPYSVRKTVVEHIRRIRSKIEPDPKNPSYIKVVFGIGYKMEKAS